MIENDELDRDGFEGEERPDDEFELFDEMDKKKKSKPVWDFSIDDDQDSFLGDDETDEDGNPLELNFDRD